MHIVRQIAVYFIIASALLLFTSGCQTDKGRDAMLDGTDERAGDQGARPAFGTDGGNTDGDMGERTGTKMPGAAPGHGSDHTDDHALDLAPSQLWIEPAQIALSPGETWKVTAVRAIRNGNNSSDKSSNNSGDGSAESFEPVDPSALRWTSDVPQWVGVDADGNVTVAENAPIGVKANITAEHGHAAAALEVTVKYSLAETVLATGDANAIPVVTNPDSLAVVVNKKRSLPDDYRPDDLVEPNVRFSFDEKHDKRLLRKEAAEALEQLFAQAEQDGIQLFAVSGFRAYNTQRAIFERNVNEHGEEHARRFSAYPGTSEHQTGLAMDVSSASVGYRLVQSFGETEEGRWLAENAHLFGFIIRYPEGKEHLTGYAYEPWHLRYVGEWIARDIYEQEVTLEQYFEEAIPVWGETR